MVHSPGAAADSPNSAFPGERSSARTKLGIDRKREARRKASLFLKKSNKVLCLLK